MTDDSHPSWLPLLPWNPEAKPDPARQAVVRFGTAGGRVYIGIATYYGSELHSGLLTPGEARRLGEALVAAADAAEEAGRG